MNLQGSQKTKSKTAAIVGWQGYSGLELAGILQKHPQIDLVAGFSRNPQVKPETISSKLGSFPVYLIDDLQKMQNQFDVLFFATPPEFSKEWIAKLSTKSLIVDLSNALRFSPELAVFGLQPFQEIEKEVVANPGCYVTSVLMALVPLLKHGLIEKDSIVIDAKSGTTGAGKSAKTGLLFSEIFENCSPYKVAAHQHEPEIKKYLQEFSGVEIADLFFTTHLLPVKRGIISSIYCKTSASESVILEAYSEAYKKYPLFNAQVITGEDPLMKLSEVTHTAKTNVSFKVRNDQLYLFSCIDNLQKGAASQAVENMNRFLQFPVTTGLI